MLTQQTAHDETNMNRVPETAAPSPKSGSCSTCGQAASTTHLGSESAFVYAIGKIEPRFPRQSIEKEFAQLVSREPTKNLTDRQTLYKVLSRTKSRYVARQICWCMEIEGFETYLLVPRDSADLTLLIEALRPEPSHTDRDVVIGTIGPTAPPDFCNGLALPIVVFDQIYSFDQHALIDLLPKPEGTDPELFQRSSFELFDRILHLADNNGSTDSDRALNYLAVRYPAIYAKVAEAYQQNSSLSSVDVHPSHLGGSRKIVDVIFSFKHRETDLVSKFFVRVDVSDEFPFLVNKLAPYYHR
jgi:PatG C-terminal